MAGSSWSYSSKILFHPTLGSLAPPVDKLQNGIRVHGALIINLHSVCKIYRKPSLVQLRK